MVKLNVNKEIMSSRLLIALARPQYDESPDEFAKKIQHVLQPQTCVSLPKSWQNINTLEDTHRWLHLQLAQAQLYTISNRQTSDLLGVAVLHEHSDEAYIGYVIANEYWGQGFASEALQTLIACYKEQTTIKTLVAGVDKDNIGSIKVLTKSGFTQVHCEHNDSNTLHYTFSLID
ncbi:GNAT family N-acetyltransferase [Pseudoalteromonas byunsanensis]|uniref:N-acetyltransferase domain-containing protein n=1 Tax=Pseudoalteromonas byunsanensis TaxID=327939 RepID=A0A1S1N5K5_9GAMM|nr:GNAT family N-acetyltransferase [Pseudoalteromonas byunsanensis]OHU96522.1 hypothetical protein BIW53_04120 [Pseudoalteromonas byunsanensis]